MKGQKSRIKRKDTEKIKQSKTTQKRYSKRRPERKVKVNRTLKSKKAIIAARKKRQRKRLVLEFLGAIMITGTMLLFLSLFLFTFAKVEGYSMVPTLRDGDWVYVNKLGKLKTFKLVYVQIPGKKEKEIRRIIGVPGEKISYKNDCLQINGEDREEKFIFNEKQVSQENGRFYTENFSLATLTNKITIPENQYLLLGDNRPYSVDSRKYGLIDKKFIIGVVEMRLLPLHLWQRY